MAQRSMPPLRAVNDKAREDVAYTYLRILRFHRQTKAEQVEEIRRRGLHSDPEGYLPFAISRQRLFTALPQDEQIQYAYDLYEFRDGRGSTDRANQNMLFFCPLIAQYIQGVRGGTFIRTRTDNCFRWILQNRERFALDMPREEGQALQDHIFQYLNIVPLPEDQQLRLPPIQRSSRHAAQGQISLPRLRYLESQSNSSSSQHNRRRRNH
ncbi:hypothetical protein F4814DRAFT_446471 [Daldinia grandis]|nr:hypothetical protein F4814DRAFT_446471 [Daldinia grandis]